jgi:hypothetical protein
VPPLQHAGIDTMGTAGGHGGTSNRWLALSLTASLRAWHLAVLRLSYLLAARLWAASTPFKLDPVGASACGMLTDTPAARSRAMKQ